MVRFGLAISAAALLVMGLAFVTWMKPATGMTLADGLHSLEQLGSFEATQRNAMGVQNLHYFKPAMLRIDQSSQYVLHRDGQSWEVNEAENRATRSAASLFENNQLNIRKLLRLPGDADLSEEPIEVRHPEPGLEERLYHLGRSTLQLRWQVSQKNRQTKKIILIDQAQQPVREEEFTLTSTNAMVNPEAFQLKDTLTEDGRVGVVQDIQGLVAVRPVGRERWTPLAVGDLLKPGDMVRANPRGANAARLRMAPNTDVTFGPGSTLELKTPTEYRLYAGEIEVHPRGRKVTVISQAHIGTDKTVVEAKTVLQADADKLLTMNEPPAWLKGFQGTVVNESLGQLLAKVDGRNVPLTVGYHKVDVDIRDGLARTTVEESFINSTPTELEGTFYFPLPSDASIAGFGMWIGNELVEADIVEKQRAREIFDIILSEKKDPALLEWAGGNLFKTRVYPIPAHGEKRIKITYTQALPLEGNRFRYSYALLSDLLKAHPLKKLEISLTVSSTLPLAKVHSPTHAVREEKTNTAARLVFSAQEYVPTRDFEAVIELASHPMAVTMLPHRRGDDGYFLLRLAPPQASGGWERDIVRDGPPLNVLLLCDTSVSIDKNQRQQQKAFVDALLGSLSAKDTFNLACFDVETDWVFPQQQPADIRSITAAQTMLNTRRSMGWTDFEKAFASVQKQASQVAGTVVIYLGDGIPAMSWGHDPKVLCDKLKGMIGRDKVPVHAVALGSTHEPMTLRAMANLSGGSWRKIAADRGPAMQARDLLQELTDPALLRDLKVSFAGITTAKVYPEILPNVQQGTGLILTGRYLPGKAQTGTVTVSGLRGNTPVSYQAKITLPEGDAGNSFIPRLWARQHIESLLESGGNANREEIIARSEEFHLITPYTSMLVLENDAMRERFAVKKRFNMRDGERFFADGRTQSELLLRQKQMKLAADWRTNMQRTTLAQLGLLGKGQAQAFPVTGDPNKDQMFYYEPSLHLISRSPSRRGMRLPQPTTIYSFTTAGAGGFADSDGSAFDQQFAGSAFNGTGRLHLGAQASGESIGQGFGGFGGGQLREDEFGIDVAGGVSLDNLSDSRADHLYSKSDGDGLERDSKNRNYFGNNFTPSLGERGSESEQLWGTERMNEKYDKRVISDLAFGKRSELLLGEELAEDEFDSTKAVRFARERTRGGRGQAYFRQPYNPLNLQQIFPHLPAAPLIAKPTVGKAPVWSPEIVDIVKSLDQLAKIRDLQGSALVLDRVVESYDVRRGALSHLNKRTEYLSSTGWLVSQVNDMQPGLIEWCTASERAVLNLAYLTGRIRPSSQPEREQLPIEWADKSLEDLLLTFGQLPAKLEKQTDGLVRITLTYPETLSVIWTIDTQRKVLVKVEHLNAGKINVTEEFHDFQQVAGRWWATRLTISDDKGRLVSQAVQKVQAIAPEIMTARLAEVKKQQANCLMLPAPLPTLAEAKKATAPGGSGGAVEHLIMLSHFAATQQWARVKVHLDQLEREKYAAIPLVRLLVQYASRDHATMQQDVWKQTEALLKTPMPALNDEWARATFLRNHLSSVASPAEMLRYLEAHGTVFTRQPAHLRTVREQQKLVAQYLANSNRRDEALALWKTLANADLFDATTQWSYFTTLLQMNDIDAAHRHFFMLIEPNRQVFLGEDDNQQYWQQLFMKLYEMGRYTEMFSLASQWVKRMPTQRLGHQAYLLSLILTEQEDEFHRTQLSWIQAGPGAKSGTVQDRQFESALSVALNHSQFGFEHNWRQQNQVDERLHAPLIAFAEAYLSDPRAISYVQQVLSSSAGQTAKGMALRESLPSRVVEAAASMPHANLYALIQNAGYVVSRNEERAKRHKQQWVQVTATLKTRWQTLTDAKAKYDMGSLLSQVLQQRIESAAYLAFLRERLENEAREYRLGHLNNIYAHLSSQEMTSTVEKELFSLLQQLDNPDQPKATLLLAQSQRLAQLVDRLLQSRINRLHAAIPEKGKLDRVKLQEKQAAATKQAHREVYERLQQPDVVKLETLTPWVEVEILYHRIKAGDDAGSIAAATWKAYDAVPAAQSKLTLLTIKTYDDLHQLQLDVLYDSVRNRHLTVLTYLASLPKAKQPDAAAKLKDFIASKMKAEPNSDYWKMAWQRLLIALDQPKELEVSLKEWLQTSGTDQRYRLMLAYLQAERGGLHEAVELLEKVKTEDELAPADWRALSDWLLALDQQARHHQAKIQQYATFSEQALYGWLQQQLALVQRQGQGIPSQLNVDTFLVIPELFRKTQSPAHYFHTVQALYEATKDFRLLTGMADGTLGHTPGQVYEMLQHWRRLINVLQEEATLDELSKRIDELRKSSTSNVDRRALDLLQAFLHRKAATQINQPGVHAKQAVECLQRAMQHAWQPEEPAALARLIQQMHQEDHAAWKEELTAVYTRLMELTTPGSQERVEVTYYYSTYHPQPFQLLERAIEEVRSKQKNGLLPEYSQLIVGAYLGMSVGHEQATEALAQQELARPGYSMVSREWFKNQLESIFVRAYQTKGKVSLGQGEQLYRALETLFEKAVQSAPSQERRSHYIGQLCALYQQAKGHHQPTVVADCKAMLMTRILPALKALSHQRRDVTINMASTLENIVGKNEAMQFLLDEYDRAPISVRRLPYDGWEAYNSYLAQWRAGVTDATLLDRYFQIVVKRLTNYLVHGSHSNEVFFRGHSYYWAEKEDAFAATALAVFAAREPAPDLAERVANYLRGSINKPLKAVDFLQSIRRTAAFNENVQYLLATTLMEVNKHAEAVVELKQLYAARPSLRYGLRLMGCYNILGQREQLQQALAAVEKVYAPKGVWNLGDLSRVAQTCYETQLYLDAERLYGILIPQARQANPNPRQDEMWNYYRYQALTLIELNKTGPALDSIASAILLWGSTFQQRADVLESLRTVMDRAKDPQAVINYLDAETRKNNGKENVLLRRMLAEVLITKQKHGLAVSQLKLVLEFKPDDDAASKLLIQAYDALGQSAEALQAALHRSEYVSRQTATWKELGDRLTKLNQAAQAERAYTSLIEVLPNDADSEMALAQVREGQNRWEEAVGHWKIARDYRSEDPSGLLGLAKAYLHQKQWPHAQATIDQLRKPAKPWHQRFDALNVKGKVEELTKRMNEGKK